jgi:putative nucleotidyltransferase with HDIG domain
MDLRDHETEGHSRRVTEMAMRLARAIGISEVELVHMRRGALLHDIGKLGVPDAILNKPGPLTEGEHFVIPGDRPVVVCADVLDLSASRGQESVSSVE